MQKLPFDTVLIANRGEIAVRIIKTLRELELRSAIVYHDFDAGTPAVSMADVAVPISGRTPVAAYLDNHRCRPRFERWGDSPGLWIFVGECGICSQGVGGRHRVHWAYSREYRIDGRQDPGPQVRSAEWLSRRAFGDRRG
ncbi:hypothetical protein DBIPINDM_008014 (plasmid) [Mesorhizobium sp. AR02]|nr:hypothetical protein DBIPINDM_008014 [Mesorhizobium sp. AR02]